MNVMQFQHSRNQIHVELQNSLYKLNLKMSELAASALVPVTGSHSYILPRTLALHLMMEIMRYTDR
jgi:hypothetical protein